MEILAEMIRSIAVVIILSLCLELLLPKSELQPYIRTVSGLLLIVAVLSPLKNAGEILRFENILQAPQHNTEQIISAGSELRADWEHNAEASRIKNMNSQIESILLLDNDIIAITAECYYNDEILCAELQIDSLDASKNKQKKWLGILESFFGIQTENVQMDIVPQNMIEKGAENG